MRFAIAGLVLLTSLGAQTPPEPRAARSVHLRYQGPPAVAFYNELTVNESVSGSYFMACGFRQGYFGIQERSPGQDRVVIFSVWDPGAQNDPGGVPAAQRVETLYRADDVLVRRFGGEGTGGQSFFTYPGRADKLTSFWWKLLLRETRPHSPLTSSSTKPASGNTWSRSERLPAARP
jgi:hypothetical protein